MSNMSTKQMMNTEMNMEERSYWREMKKALREHNDFYVRKEFYPHNMSAWEKEHREIENSYRTNLNEMISKRVKFEKEEEQRENEKLAAEALLMMKARAEKQIERDANRKRRASERLAMKQEEALNSGNIRRSTRIANKK
jgi:hypothetical protein